MKIIILAAHPDDETLGCGGTLIRLCSQKENSSHLITFTNGEGSRDIDDDRRIILDKVTKKLHIDKYDCGNFPDNKMDTVPLLDICKYIESVVDCIPDLIFTHHRNCNNIDHRLVYQATITVFRPQKGDKHQILSYYVPSSTDYNPYNKFKATIYYDITDTIDKKIEVLKLYDKEMREWPHTRSYQNISTIAMYYGSQVGLKFAEAFELVRAVL